MVRLVRVLLRSLEIRLFLPLLFVVAVVISAHAVLGFSATRQRLRAFARDDVERSARLIGSATHDGMLLNRLGDVQATLQRLGESPEFTTIRVYDKKGRVALAANPHERGSLLTLENERCRACHVGDEVPGAGVLSDASHFVRVDSHDENRFYTVIRNEPDCSSASCHVHPEEQQVLGVLEVGMSLEPFERAVNEARSGLLGTTVARVALCGAVAGVFVRRVIHEPVARLHEGTARIAKGDLETRIEVRGHDELAALATAFNRMVKDLRDARSELSEWSRTLEEKVEVKSLELEQAREQMVRVETMASLGKLSATVAHELNNPIGGILAYAKLVRREVEEQPLDEEIKADLVGCLSLIEQECVRCGDIVRNMLAFARGRGLRMRASNLNEIVRRSLMLVRHHLEMRGIRLKEQGTGHEVIVTLDPDQIQQALLAMMMNAVEAMPTDGGGVLSVRVREEGQDVTIEVSDTGCGIPESMIHKVFEPFYSTKTEKSGVGLGLAVVYGVIQSHNGTVVCESRENEGTTFRVTLPRKQPEADSGAEPTEAEGQETGAMHA